MTSLPPEQDMSEQISRESGRVDKQEEHQGEQLLTVKPVMVFFQNCHNSNSG